MTTTSRIYALDNLRGVLMWLGIILHVAVNYVTKPFMPWYDNKTTEMADLLVALIHAFRMPAFFILAGFFLARLIEARGVRGMLANRLRRIGLPFLLFWPIMLAGLGSLMLMYVHLRVRGTIGVDPSLMPPAGRARLPTMHLWFLYDLLLLCLFAALACFVNKRLPGNMFAASSAVGGWFIRSWWGPVLLAVPLGLLGASYPKGFLVTSGTFVPSVNELLFYGLFFIAGSVLYAHRAALLPRLERTCWWYAASGLVAFVLAMVTIHAITAGHPPAYATHRVAFLYGATSWFWSFALVGAFSKYLGRQRPWLSYLAESSYWVYMVHMLGTIGFGVLLYNTGFGAGARMLMNIAATTVLCLLSYHWLVRGTWVGVLLNGQRRTAGNRPAAGTVAQHS